MLLFRGLIGASFLLLTAGTTTDAQRAIVAMDYDQARTLLGTLDPHQPEAALQWAHYFMQLDDCEGALAFLPNELVSKREDASQLAAVAYGCTRSMAESLVVEDEKHHVVIRYQNGRRPIAHRNHRRDVAAAARYLDSRFARDVAAAPSRGHRLRPIHARRDDRPPLCVRAHDGHRRNRKIWAFGGCFAPRGQSWLRLSRHDRARTHARCIDQRLARHRASVAPRRHRQV